MFFKFNLAIVIIALFCIIGTLGRSQIAPSCKSHGNDCNTDAECCNNAVCHRFAKKCQTPIDAQSLQAQRDRLRHTDSGRISQPSAAAGCKQHGYACVSSSECCSGAKCHPYAGRCQIEITPQMLQDQRARLRHVDNKYH